MSTGLAIAMVVEWSSGRRNVLNNVVSEIWYIHIPELVVVRTCFDRRVRLPVQGALTFRRGRTFVSRSWSWSVSGLGRDAPSGIWATPRPLDLGHGGIRRAEVSGMSVGRSIGQSVATVESRRPEGSRLRAVLLGCTR